MGGGGLKCDDNHDMVDGLCYNKCPTGSTHATAMPYLCQSGGHGPSYTANTGTIPGCKPGQVKSGAVCYDEPPPGYHNLAGTEWQDCPPGARDSGVGCFRESYTRDIGAIPWVGLFLNKGIVASICIAIALYIVIRIGYSIYSSRQAKSATKP